MTRDSLAKALYCRTVATIVRRANSLKRLGSTSGTLSSDSNESVHNQAEVRDTLIILVYIYTRSKDT
jgi:dachs protein